MTKKILCVDDDPMFLWLVEELLSKAGYEVRSTIDGSNAIKLTDQWKPDLILLDIVMLGMDGFMVAKRIREFSSTPIIILSAKGEEGDILRGFEVGVDDYIVKPFSSVEILARVRAVLRRFNTEDLKYHGVKFQHGDLIIDTEAARVLKGGNEIKLSVLQFKLIATLAVSMGKILTHEELLASIWGPAYRRAKTILWVSINRLRQKIEEDPKHPIHIITVPRIGYIMPKKPGGLSNGNMTSLKLGSPKEEKDASHDD
jgi:DNA-binding response OmpR family regulator